MDYDQFTEQDWDKEFQHLGEPKKDMTYYKNLAARYKALADYKESVINKLLDKIVALQDNSVGGYQPINTSGTVHQAPKKP